MSNSVKRESDRLLSNLEDEITSFYSGIESTLTKTQNRMLSNYYKQLEIKKDQLDNNEITEDEYRDWLRSQASSSVVRNTAQKLTEQTVNADSRAVDIINGAMAGIYVLNRLASQKKTAAQAEAIKSKYGVTTEVHVATKEEIYAEYKRRSEIRNKNKSLFQASLNKAKDTAWTHKHFEDAIYHGVRAGYSQRKMEAAIKDMMGENYRSSIRYARTYATANEGKAVYENGLQMDDDGWQVTKEWQSLHDHRVRNSHRNQDKETIDIKDYFTNGLLYPGDRSKNDPGEYINCRCRMEVDIVGVKDDKRNSE